MTRRRSPPEAGKSGLARGAESTRKHSNATASHDQRLVWDDLKVLLAVHRGGSLARGAELLGVDPATVSRRIAALEAALGVILFKRSSAGVVATDAGSAVLLRAAEVEHRMRLIEEDLAAEGEPAGVVRIVGGPWVVSRLAAVAAPLLKAAHPAITLRLVACRPNADLETGPPTISLWFEAPLQENEFSIVLGDVPYALYGAAGANLGTLPLLVHRSENGPPRASDRWARRAPESSTSPALSATDSIVLREAVRGGLGKALLPICLAAYDPDFVRVGKGQPDLMRPLHVYVHPDSVQLARLQAVIGTLRENFADAFGEGRPV
ncbi:MAG: LysR family transcriptional regulator [Pseudomonadota bacterium]